jgi:hypothetical protein
MTITPSSTAPGEAAGKPADIHFYFDPVCPFAWTTSKRVRTVAPLYEAVSSEIFDSSRAAEITAQERGSRTFVEPLLSRAGLPAGLADALDDTGWDSELQAETDHALTLIGKDVGTPIIHFQPPEGSRSSARSSAVCQTSRTRAGCGTTSSAWLSRLRRDRRGLARRQPPPEEVASH